MKTSPLKSNKEVDLSSDTITRDVLLLREKINGPKKELERKQEDKRKLQKQKPNPATQLLISNLSGDIKKIQKEIDGYNNQITELENKLITSEQKLSSMLIELEEEITVASGKIQEAEQQLLQAKSTREYDKLIGDIELNKTSIESLNKEKKQTQDELTMERKYTRILKNSLENQNES